MDPQGKSQVVTLRLQHQTHLLPCIRYYRLRFLEHQLEHSLKWLHSDNARQEMSALKISGYLRQEQDSHMRELPQKATQSLRLAKDIQVQPLHDMLGSSLCLRAKVYK